MSKFIQVALDNRVVRIEDSLPDDGFDWIEVQDDNVELFWHFIKGEDGAPDTVEQFKTLHLEEVREIRNSKLLETDWMLLEDSKYKQVGQEENLANIKTYRQQLRDYPQNNSTVKENSVWPELVLI